MGRLKGLWIPIEILQSKDLSPLEKILLSYIKIHERKGCNATNSTLAKMIGVSSRTVSRGLSKLMNIGLISVREQNHKRLIFISQNVQQGQFDHIDQNNLSNEYGQNVLPYNNCTNNREQEKEHMNIEIEEVNVALGLNVVEKQATTLEDFCNSFSKIEQDTYNLDYYYNRVIDWARKKKIQINNHTELAKLFIKNDEEKHIVKFKPNKNEEDIYKSISSSKNLISQSALLNSTRTLIEKYCQKD